ncbi:alpha beta-hydrolase [Coniophora puteana RWD-64-598 SS2]|uniref:Alpha beta-hydrolase n=1 Tax=Coniophora puteana (strain RWD-64-598) TaxID=741705 RepID=A0A5M3MVF5_CONPW|nr:alpha beta-hydrolase [Coniophora puteana RWD-64-598 SS2]EIW83152.1 alpha beta-hydrolase [Coniophora puteana RWD-64-598 SS2]
MFAYRKQPWKALYLTFQLTSLLVRIPLWSLFLLIPRFRPCSEWSFAHAVMVFAIKQVTEIFSNTGEFLPVPDHRTIKPATRAKGVWVDAAAHAIVGDLVHWACIAGVQPERIPGYWHRRVGVNLEHDSPAQKGEKVIYRIHGGGFVQLSAHPSDFAANIDRCLIEHVEAAPRSFSIEYRLASAAPFSQRFPFPAALLDALAGYVYLVKTIGFDPSNIVVVGDSAGGNIAFSLVRYLVEYRSDSGGNVPAPPGSLILLSPWVDLSTSHEIPGSSTLVNTTDFVGPENQTRNFYSKVAYAGPLGLEFITTSRYTSPACLYSSYPSNFYGFPRTLLVCGKLERFRDAIRTLKEKMSSDMGEGDGDGQVTLLEVEKSVHNFLIFNWHPQRDRTIAYIRKWLQ